MSTPIGKTIARILLEQESAQSLENKYTPPASLGQPACKKDTCCQWYWAANVMNAAFFGKFGRCNSLAREAVRTWSQKLASQGKDFGGADGRIVLTAAEIQRAENNGLQDIVDQMWAWSAQFGVGMGDLIQFDAAVAVVTCPLGPRMRVFVGRKDRAKAAPEGLLPDVNDSADKLISLFRDKTISPHALVALLGAHTTSEQFFVDTKRAGAPQDGTTGVWGTLSYNPTLGLGPLPKEVFRFPSDIVLAKDVRTADEWKSSGSHGQSHWNEDYAFAYTRLSLLGVNNINDLKECTKVLPMPKLNFKGAGELLKDQ
ncbi:ligninase h2 precursor [Paraphaeosphaeria minitans]|uniref:Peroxidase n=1 Tax=Paraphaeosphaeria minitans TaxID=565426 RepID=A0A9P6GR76_9PLEO|nr:ligninase h2 precursor [Paraphaeosphaeria minitans]